MDGPVLARATAGRNGRQMASRLAGLAVTVNTAVSVSGSPQFGKSRLSVFPRRWPTKCTNRIPAVHSPDRPIGRKAGRFGAAGLGVIHAARAQRPGVALCGRMGDADKDVASPGRS